jgi:hypothetical protein
LAKRWISNQSNESLKHCYSIEEKRWQDIAVENVSENETRRKMLNFNLFTKSLKDFMLSFAFSAFCGRQERITENFFFSPPRAFT